MNKLMSMSVLQLVLYALGFALLFVALLYVTYQPPKEGGAQLLNWLYMSLGILAGHILGTGQSKSTASLASAVAPSGQSGRSLLSFLSFLIFCGLAVAAALAMSGCTMTTGAMYRGYMTEAEAGIKTWDDNAIATTRAVMCAQPYSAIQRHPEIQAMVAAGCGPIANTSTLDANQLQLLMNLMNASGVKLQAAPAGSK